MTYSTCSDWAASQRGITPEARQMLLLLAFDIDKGKDGATRDRLGIRAELNRDARFRAIQELEAKGLIEAIGVESIGDSYSVSDKTRTRNSVVYAPKGWQK